MMCTEVSQAGHFLRDQLERHEPPKQYDQKDKGKFSAPGDGFAPLVDITCEAKPTPCSMLDIGKFVFSRA